MRWTPPEGDRDGAAYAERRDAQAASLCESLLGWGEGAAASCEVTVITGGITNSLFRVVNRQLDPSDPKMSVILRVFGDNTDLLIDRPRELSVLRQLNAIGFGAEVYETFENGRIEEYLESKALDAPQCTEQDTMCKIARTLAKFHGAQVDGPKEPAIWDQLLGWCDMASKLTFEDEAKRKSHAAIDFAELERAIGELQSRCDTLKPAIVFSHQDLLSGNIMMHPTTGDVTFIDFEYSGYGYQGYDIANHWNECMGFECDLSLYPSPEKRRLFVQEYIRAWDENASGAGKDCEALLLEADFFVLVSHLFWGVWAVIQVPTNAVRSSARQSSATC